MNEPIIIKTYIFNKTLYNDVILITSLMNKKEYDLYERKFNIRNIHVKTDMVKIGVEKNYAGVLKDHMSIAREEKKC